MKLSLELEKYRIKQGEWKSPANAPFGGFMIPFRSNILQVMACDGRETGWDHVSVSLPNRNPNWDEMSFIKDLFFGEEETVIQFHPKKSAYVNIHSHCLHLWKPINGKLGLPPKILV